ncbi:MAG: Rrf2 family transcriptional regulator [Lachnospiraceae bacterium]|nr:Rrf2 family transcriptional regulator [Lachnospiraceae bacterium]
MKVSTRVEYGLVAITDIVLHSEKGKSVSAPEIAERQHISHKYLEQILLLLRQAGFIKAQKGLRGGYALCCPASEIRLSDVLNALDGSILSGMEEDDAGDLRSVINKCFWNRINSNLKEYAENMKLSEFAAQCQNNLPESWDLYMI